MEYSAILGTVQWWEKQSMVLGGWQKKWVCERLIFVMHLEDHQLAEVKKMRF